MKILKPIFFIGMGRSGTTIISEIVSSHESVGWLSNYSSRLPRRHGLNVLRRFSDNRFWWLRGEKAQGQHLAWWNRLVPRPNEAYPFWGYYCGDKFRRTFLRGVDATAAERETVRKAIGQILWWQGRSRLMVKLTGPPRIHYLNSIFSDAIFVHIVRDGRAVVDSLLKVDFWNKGGQHTEPKWQGGLQDADYDEWREANCSSLVLTAIEWRKVVEATLAEKDELPPGRFFEIRYEDFIDDPHGCVSRLSAQCGLADSGRVHRYIDERPSGLPSMNFKYRARPQEEIAAMEQVMGRYLVHYGYM